MKRLLTLLLTLVALPVLADDVSALRANVIDYYTAARAPRSLPRVVSALEALEGTTRHITSPGYFLSDGSWSDIDYTQTPNGSWGPWDHSRRLLLMAKAYRTPGQALYGDPTLLTQINAAMRYELRFYGSSVLPLGNWWFWTIGIPLDLGPTLVLMQGDVDQKTFDDLVAALALRIGSSPTSRGLVGPTPVGENLVWSSFNHLCLGILRNDLTRLHRVRDAMAGVTLVNLTAEGIKPDGSFHHHGAQLYTGGYGASFAHDVARYVVLTTNTPFALPPASLASFADYLVDGIAWSMYGSSFDVSVLGREVARETTSGVYGVSALSQMALVDTPRAAEIRAAAAQILARWPHTLSSELAGAAAIAEASAYPAWPSGHRHYFSSDYTVHRRPSYFASVRMFSTRTRSGEKTNGEHIRGSRQSDGRFHLSLSGDEHAEHVWPVFDWSRLPGITVEQKADAANDSYGYGTRMFAGGTDDGRNGVSAMEVAPLGSALTARKAWFFFDDVIVFLTNSITSLSSNRVETIVEQWPLRDATKPVLVNGTTHSGDGPKSGVRWALADGIGYLFPKAETVHFKRANQTGTWAGLGGSSDTTERSKTIFTLWLDHGTNPVNATVEYAIVPNATSAQMSSWAVTPPFTVLANHDRASVVRNDRDGSHGFVFWTAGSYGGWQSSAGLVVYATPEGNNLRLSASDPNAGWASVRLTIPGRWTSSSAPGVVAATTSTTITIPSNGGRAWKGDLTPAPPVTTRRRATK